MRRITERSTFRYDGPRTGLRDADPMVKIGASAKAAVLNHSLVVRSSAGRFGLSVRFGRCTPKPANAFAFGVCVTAIGAPDCTVTTAVAVHPFATSQTADAAKRCGMSPVE